MTTPRLFARAVVLTMASAGAIAGCARKENPAAPTPAPTAAVTSLSIAGNTALTAPGQTTRFAAHATFSDGSTTDVTSIAEWYSSNVYVIAVAPGGLARATGLGKADVSASLRGTLAPGVAVTVLPEGTYIVSGRVTEPGNYPIPDVEVEALGAGINGLTTTTDSSGMFAFNGVSGVTQVRATKDGYQSVVADVTSDSEHANIVLSPIEANAAIGGVYRLTFIASPSCQLADDARTRTYTARVDQDGPLLTVTLSDAQFGAYFGNTWNVFSGRVLGNMATFALNAGYAAMYEGGVAEQLEAGRYLMLSGTADASIAGSPIAASLAGTVSVIKSPQDLWGPIASCSAADHQLIFTRSGAARLRR